MGTFSAFPTQSARDFPMAKLAVAQKLVYEDEYPEAHNIIKDSITDLTRLWPKTEPA